MSRAGARGGASPSRALVVAAFAAVWGIWGSTYLAIAVAVETLPPLLMVSLRCLLAGSVLLAWARLRGEAWPGWRRWVAAAKLAVFLFGAYGLVAWAERTVPSGTAALLSATSPVWVVMLDPRVRGRGGALAGVALGLVGVAALTAPWRGGAADPAGVVALLGAALLWGAGSLRSRSAPVPGSPLLATALELLTGSALVGLAGLALGEAGAVHPGAVSGRSLLALGYLVVFGSLVAYTAFHWLLRVSSPALVSTHAYVNPVIALALGWLLHGEALGLRTLTAAALVLAGVVVLTRAVQRARAPSVPAPARAAERAGSRGKPGRRRRVA